MKTHTKIKLIRVRLSSNICVPFSKILWTISCRGRHHHSLKSNKTSSLKYFRQTFFDIDVLMHEKEMKILLRAWLTIKSLEKLTINACWYRKASEKEGREEEEEEKQRQQLVDGWLREGRNNSGKKKRRRN